MTIYILNSPILTDYGVYEFRKINLETAKSLLQNKNFVSAIGHESTAKLLSQLLGIEIPVNRVQITMRVGDKAIIFRILTRLPEGKVLSEEELKSVPFEVGLLRKIG